jgi:methylphosphotriester-DNA--protein-cysteine methyltransferase
VLEKYLIRKICKINPVPDIVDYAVKAIIQKKGIVSISQLSDDLCISPRQFRRRFTEKIGITPKMCARIKRFNYVTNLSADAFANWMDMVHEGGYYDQAHFIRDFSDFSGKSPTEFMHYNQKMAQLMGA